MNEPFTTRLSSPKNRQRLKEFEKVLNKRCANPTDVLRGLVDAYIKCDGAVPWPWKLIPEGDVPVRSTPLADGQVRLDIESPTVVQPPQTTLNQHGTRLFYVSDLVTC